MIGEQSNILPSFKWFE